MFTPVGTVLKTLPGRSRAPEAILALSIRRIFRDALNKVCQDLDGKLLLNVKAATFKRGVLTVNAPNLMSTELSMRAGGLVREINSVLGKKVIRKLKFKTF